MKNLPTISVVLSCLLAGHAHSASVEVEMSLLEEKAELCLISLDESKCKNTRHCDDMSSYSDYIFKGSSGTWVKYNVNSNRINSQNFDQVMRALDANKKALGLINELPNCS